MSFCVLYKCSSSCQVDLKGAGRPSRSACCKGPFRQCRRGEVHQSSFSDYDNTAILNRELWQSISLQPDHLSRWCERQSWSPNLPQSGFVIFILTLESIEVVSAEAMVTFTQGREGSALAEKVSAAQASSPAPWGRWRSPACVA